MDSHENTHTSYERQQFQKEDVVMNVISLSVWTPEEKSWWRRKPTKQKSVILNNVSANIKRNELVAIIGPSGAGKTTFLVSLAGKCTLPSSGHVTLRGRNVKECPGSVEIVPQYEVFFNSLSVMEHLIFMTEIKLGSHKQLEYKRRLNTMIDELQLYSLRHTPIRALSGGERRLLSLASSLLSDPQILLCDEPTTGLDSYNALLVAEVLKKLSVDKVIICSVHQPSCDLFHVFSSIMLMTEGRLLFHGTQHQCEELFQSIGLHCPLNYNPAEFYIKALSNLNENLIKLIDLSENQLVDDNQTLTEQISYRITQRNWFRQVQLLMWRLSLSGRRLVLEQLIQMFLTVIITAMVFGVVYAGISGTTQQGIQNIQGFLWLILCEVAFGVSYSVLYTFKDEMPMFKREVGMYGCSAYFVSRFLSLIPRCVAWPLILVTMTITFMELPNHTLTALQFYLTLFLTAIPAMAYGLGMAAMFTWTGSMGEVMSCANLPLMLAAGYFLSISSLPIWMYPMKYISHFYYAMDALSNVYWRQIDHIDCPSNSTTTCMYDGASVLSGNGYSEQFILQDLLGFLVVTVFWSLLGYYGLKREERKGYAY